MGAYCDTGPLCQYLSASGAVPHTLSHGPYSSITECLAYKAHPVTTSRPATHAHGAQNMGLAGSNMQTRLLLPMRCRLCDWCRQVCGMHTLLPGGSLLYLRSARRAESWHSCTTAATYVVHTLGLVYAWSVTCMHKCQDGMQSLSYLRSAPRAESPATAPFCRGLSGTCVG